MEGAYRWRKEYGGLKVSTTTPNAHTLRWDIDLQRQWRGKSEGFLWHGKSGKQQRFLLFPRNLTAAAS